MPDNPIARRLITIPSVVIIFVVLTALLPLAVVLGAAIDIVRYLSDRKPWVVLRLLAFGWVYLLGQIWALLTLALTSPLPEETKQRITYELQRSWSSWNFVAMSRIFSVGLEVEGRDLARHGPMVVLSRHVSMVDTILPAVLIANPFHIRLRYVLKRELLVDPSLDVAGHRVPNHFIDRETSDSTSELDELKSLGSDLEPQDAVLIYPEGSRFSEAKLDVYSKRVAARGGSIGEIASGFRSVLPPKPGGTLALLDASEADVVVIAHHGLEGLATLRDIWGGGLIGSEIHVRLWRIPRERVPEERRKRIEWLYSVWARVDDWVVQHRDDR